MADLPPRLSVLMPVYNQAGFLPYALASVFRQRFAALEVILVDDGSSDAPEAAAAGFDEVRFFRQTNRGYCATLNFALTQAHGDYITFLDADDWWAEDKLVRQVGLLDSHPEVEIIVGAVQPVRCAAPDPATTVVDRSATTFPLLNLGSALMRRSAFTRVGPFDRSLRIGADWDWFLRADDLGVPLLLHDDVVLFYRRHAGNMTNDRMAVDRELLRVFKKSLDRRRAAGQTDARPLALRDRLAAFRRGDPGVR